MFKKIGNLIVLDNGNIYRENKNFCKLVKGSKNKGGYKIIEYNGKKYLYHRFIMEVFYGKSDLTVDHIDGNKENNYLYNLEYVTRQENIKRAFETGLYDNAIDKYKKSWTAEKRKKYSEKQKKKVYWNGKVYPSAMELSFILGLSKNACNESIRQQRKLKGFYAKYI